MTIEETFFSPLSKPLCTLNIFMCDIGLDGEDLLWAALRPPAWGMDTPALDPWDRAGYINFQYKIIIPVYLNYLISYSKTIILYIP